MYYLEARNNKCLEDQTVEGFLALYNDKERNRKEISHRLSYVHVDLSEGFMAVYTSKDESRRAVILKIHRKGNPANLRVVGSSAARNARAHASSLWTDVDICQEWAPSPDDPTRGTGNPFNHKRITKSLLAKTREDIKAGRGPKHAKSIYIEDHQQFQRMVSPSLCTSVITLTIPIHSYAISILNFDVRVWQILQRELTAGLQLVDDLAAAAAMLDTSDIEQKERESFSKWATNLTVGECVRFAVTLQRESGGRAEITNLRKRELRVEFHGVTEQPGITKTRRDGNTDPCCIKHTACGPFCYRNHVDLADEEGPPPLTVMLQRTEKFLALKHKDQGICCACAYVMFDRVMNVRWHAQQNSTLAAQHWPLTSRFKGLENAGEAFVMPNLVCPEKREKLTVDSLMTPIFSPLRALDAKPSDVQTKYIRIYQLGAWPDMERITMFGIEPFIIEEYKSHSNKQGTGFDLGVSSAPPSLIQKHLHHLNLPTTGFYQQWPLQETDVACALLSQPRCQTTDVVLTNAEILRHLGSLVEKHDQFQKDQERLRSEHRSELAALEERHISAMMQSERRMSAMAASVAQLVSTVMQAGRENAGHDVNSAVVQMLSLNNQIQLACSGGLEITPVPQTATPVAPAVTAPLHPVWAAAPPIDIAIPAAPPMPMGMPPPKPPPKAPPLHPAWAAAPPIDIAIPAAPPMPMGMPPPVALPPAHSASALPAAAPPVAPALITWTSSWILEAPMQHSVPPGTLLVFEHDPPPRVLKYILFSYCQGTDSLVVQPTHGEQAASLPAAKFRPAMLQPMEEDSTISTTNISTTNKRLAAPPEDDDDFASSILICGVGGCTTTCNSKIVLYNHKRRASICVSPNVVCSQSGTHKKSDWHFWVAANGTHYCARGKDAKMGLPQHGCRRPFGDGPGFCNASKQLALCKAPPNCKCGLVTFPTEKDKQGRAMCICQLTAQPS